MNEEKLDLSVFEKAIVSLKRALDEYQKDEQNEFIRDSCIQRFEYCYESAKKILMRHFKNTEDDPTSFDEMKFEEIIRLGAKKALLRHSWDIWNNYRENRNKTFHSYDETIAIEIVEQIPKFYTEVDHLLDKLKGYYET